MVVEKVSTVETTKMINTQMPSTFLHCRDLPVEPLDNPNDIAVKKYIIDLWSVGDECKRNLNKVRKVIERDRSK